MIAYKLCRQLKDGNITSLFIDKTTRLPFNEWLEAKSHPTKGFKERPYWHCTGKTSAPHLSEKDRVWVEVEMKDFTEFKRPLTQGGLWYLANKIKILRKIKKGEI